MNNDILVDILSRLPTKNLLRLKCVSKGWKRLISERAFVKHQLKKNEPVSGFFYQESYNWSDADVKRLSYKPLQDENAKLYYAVFDFMPEDVVVLGSSNGLVCCRSYLPSQHPYIYVCNPLNKEFVKVSFPEPNRRDSIALAFDPFRDPVTQSTKFNVMRVRQTETEADDICFSFEIYSSETGAWAKLKESCRCNHRLFKNKGIFIAGVLHWLTDGDKILTFDVENEIPYLIGVPFPVTELNSVPQVCIGESDGRLHCAILCEYGLQVWILEDYYGPEWELSFFVSLEEMEHKNPDFLYSIRRRLEGRTPFDATPPWMDLLTFKDGGLLLRVIDKVFLYSIETGKMKELCIVDKLGVTAVIAPAVVLYTTSLIPLG